MCDCFGLPEALIADFVTLPGDTNVTAHIDLQAGSIDAPAQKWSLTVPSDSTSADYKKLQLTSTSSGTTVTALSMTPAGATTLLSDLTVGGSLSVTGGLTAGAVSLDSVSATGGISAGGDLTLTGSATVGANATITGNLTVNGTLNAEVLNNTSASIEAGDIQANTLWTPYLYVGKLDDDAASADLYSTVDGSGNAILNITSPVTAAGTVTAPTLAATGYALVGSSTAASQLQSSLPTGAAQPMVKFASNTDTTKTCDMTVHALTAASVATTSATITSITPPTSGNLSISATTIAAPSGKTLTLTADSLTVPSTGSMTVACAPTFSGAVAMTSTLAVTGAVTASGIVNAGEVKVLSGPNGSDISVTQMKITGTGGSTTVTPNQVQVSNAASNYGNMTVDISGNVNFTNGTTTAMMIGSTGAITAPISVSAPSVSATTILTAPRSNIADTITVTHWYGPPNPAPLQCMTLVTPGLTANTFYSIQSQFPDLTTNYSVPNSWVLPPYTTATFSASSSGTSPVVLTNNNSYAQRFSNSTVYANSWYFRLDRISP